MERTFADSQSEPGREPAHSATSTAGTRGSSVPSGAKDAVEFIDVHKAFGRNKILRGLNL